MTMAVRISGGPDARKEPQTMIGYQNDILVVQNIYFKTCTSIRIYKFK